MTYSVSTLSSHSESPAPSLDGSESPVFDTADYSDPSFVSTDIMSIGQPALGPQYQQTSEGLFEVKAGQPQAVERPLSLGLPLRMRDDACAEADTKRNLKRATTYPVRSSTISPRRASHRAFDLMAPPPGRRKSSVAKTDLLRDSYPYDTIDANPSAALTSRIAASILRDGYGVRGPKNTAPPRVQDAVQRCAPEVSTTVQKEHAPWGLPQYRPRYSRRYPADSDVQSRTSDHMQLSENDAAGSRNRYGVSSGDEEDPFTYDKSKASMYKNLYGFGKGGRGMRARLSDASRPYSCPFRKRNPVMFNIRDHENCAKRPFFGIQELKQHIRTYHRTCGPAHSCPRCKAKFQTQSDLSEHLMVPADEMCEPNDGVLDVVAVDGITEEMDRALADRTQGVHSWEQIWTLLFPQDPSPQDSGYLPVVEMYEMEQRLDDSQAELRADLSESLRKLLPDQSAAMCTFLAGQFQLVVEQYRAKVHRKCRISASGESPPPSVSEKSKNESARMSRFSIRPFNGNTTGPANMHGRSPSLLSSPKSHGRRQSQATQHIPPRTTVSPASTTSSVYSQDPVPPAPSTTSRPTTRSSTLGMSGMQVESPRLPFKDWVQGVKYSDPTTIDTNNNNNNDDDEKKYQRDSGLALEQCEACQMEPCSCEGYHGYADQLSAFMTPAPGSTTQQPGTAPYSAADQANEDDEGDWAAQYRGSSVTPDVPAEGPNLHMEGSSRIGLDAQSAEPSELKPAAVQGFI